MIVYRAQKHAADPYAMLARLRRLAGAAAPDTGHITELLIDYGEFEAALVDEVSPDYDDDDAERRSLREAACFAAHAFREAIRGHAHAARAWLGRFQRALELISLRALPPSVRVGVAEGYAYYGLYPASYAEAAERFQREVDPHAAVTIGIRGIGTSLSAVVYAVLQDSGCNARPFTLRPRGHPFDRRVLLADRLENILRSLNPAYFLIVDEGPGLSGSSLASVAAKLSDLGIPDERIVYFPSWEPQPDALLSETARAHWVRHKKYTAGFEEIWRPPEGAVDISAGRWRPLFYRTDAESPCVQPQHERRKYLLPGGTMLKFSGLGRYGKAKLERAGQLAEAGFSPRVRNLSDGFLETEFRAGTPVRRSNAGTELLDAAASYLAFLKQTFPGGRPVPFDEITEMVRVNVEEGIGAMRLDGLSAFREPVTAGSTVAIDGRMLPHEWIATPHGYLKTDALDHHDDHFFPGCQDIAWDVAGAIVEFGLDEVQSDYFVGRYAALAGDVGVRDRLPFYTIAYLAYRLGYATLAAGALGPCADRDKFQSLAEQYRAMLRDQVTRTTGPARPYR